jgi:hypothetical protein
MSQKTSLPQFTQFVSEALPPDKPRLSSSNRAVSTTREGRTQPSDNVLRAESALESSHDVSDCKIAPAASFWSTQIRDKPKARRLPRVMEKISSIANTGSRKRLALTVLNTSF